MITSQGWFSGFAMFQDVTRRGRQNWDAMDDVSRESWEQRARGEREFIPSPSHHNREEAQTVVLPMPAPEVPMRYLATNSEEFRAGPAAMLQMAKRLEANGWRIWCTYCVGPWPKKAESVPVLEQNEDGEWIETGSVEKTTYGQAPSYVLRFRRDGQRGYAMWLAKPWTKDGDKLKFHAAQVRPGIGLIKSNDLIKLVTAPREGGNNE